MEQQYTCQNKKHLTLINFQFLSTLISFDIGTTKTINFPLEQLKPLIFHFGQMEN